MRLYFHNLVSATGTAVLISTTTAVCILARCLYKVNHHVSIAGPDGAVLDARLNQFRVDQVVRIAALFAHNCKFCASTLSTAIITERGHLGLPSIQ